MLTDKEAQALISMEKSFVKGDTIFLPPGADETRELVGSEGREAFLLDLWRATIRLSKVKYQTRGRTVVVLVRLDIDGPPHTNPDGTRMGGTHLHVYREGYEAKWAYPLDAAEFPRPMDVAGTFADFFRYCHIVDPPPVQGSIL